MADKMTRQALADQRKRLKIRLYKERRNRDLPLGPQCVYCGRKTWNADDTIMHEWLIKRSDVPVSKQYLIMHEYNCVLAHYSCHEQHGQTREFKLRAARAQYKRYSHDTIAAWVESLGLKQHIEIPTEEDCRG